MSIFSILRAAFGRKPTPVRSDLIPDHWRASEAQLAEVQRKTDEVMRPSIQVDFATPEHLAAASAPEALQKPAETIAASVGVVIPETARTATGAADVGAAAEVKRAKRSHKRMAAK